jgi:hypothetical protein
VRGFRVDLCVEGQRREGVPLECCHTMHLWRCLLVSTSSVRGCVQSRGCERGTSRGLVREVLEFLWSLTVFTRELWYFWNLFQGDFRKFLDGWYPPFLGLLTIFCLLEVLGWVSSGELFLLGVAPVVCV